MTIVYLGNKLEAAQVNRGRGVMKINDSGWASLLTRCLQPCLLRPRQKAARKGRTDTSLYQSLINDHSLQKMADPFDPLLIYDRDFCSGQPKENDGPGFVALIK